MATSCQCYLRLQQALLIQVNVDPRKIFTLSMLAKHSADYILKYCFLIFPQQIGIGISFELSPKGTICITCEKPIF